MAGQTATIISTISSDVTTYWERGSLVAEFRVGRYTVLFPVLDTSWFIYLVASPSIQV
jgi:hypothetical protein